MLFENFCHLIWFWKQCVLEIGFWVSKILLVAVLQPLSTTSEFPQHVVFCCHVSVWVWNSLSPTVVLDFFSELLMGFWNSLSTKHFDRGMRVWPLLSSPQCLLGLNWYTAVGVQFFETGLQPGKTPKPIVWMAAKWNYFSLTVNAGGKQLIYSKFLPIWIAWLYLIKMEHSTDVLFPDF